MKYAKQLKLLTKSTVTKISTFNIFFILLLLLAFYLRIGVFGNYQHFQFEYPDYSRDYLIANHIAKYGELPLTGPHSGEIGTSFGSPLYFYLLAFFLRIYNNILFLGWINLLFQISTLLIVFFLAKNMFGKTTATIAFILFGLSEAIVNQSTFVWQPYLMQPFINLSYLLLFLAYLKKNYNLLLISIPLFLISIVLHNAAIAAFPAYSVVTFLVLKKHFNNYHLYLRALIIFLTTLFLIYLPRGLYWMWYSQESVSFISSFKSIFNELPNFFVNLTLRTVVFLHSLFPYFKSEEFVLTFLFELVISFGVLSYIYFHNNHSIRNYLIILVIFISQFLIVVALMPDSPPNPFPARYFTPIYSLFVILIAEIISSFFKGKNLVKSTGVIVTALTIILLSPNLSQLISNAKNNITATSFSYVSDPAILAVKNEILSIKQHDRLPDLNFFGFASYREGYEDADTFWAMLEIEFQAKLTKVDDSAFRDYSPITNNKYLFVICPYQNMLYTDQINCPKEYLQKYPSYILIKQTYSKPPISIFLTKRVN